MYQGHLKTSAWAEASVRQNFNKGGKRLFVYIGPLIISRENGITTSKLQGI